MEDHAKLLADLTAAVSSMNAKVNDIHRAVFDLHTRKPVIERSVEFRRAEVGDLRTRVIDITKPTSTPDSSATSGASPVIPDTNLGVTIDVTAMATPTPTRCSTEGPSRDAAKLTPAFIPAAAPMPLTKWYVIGSHEADQIEVLGIVNTDGDDPGEDRRPPWPPPGVLAYVFFDKMLQHDKFQWQPWPSPLRMSTIQKGHMFMHKPLSLIECNKEGVTSISHVVQFWLGLYTRLKSSAPCPGQQAIDDNDLQVLGSSFPMHLQFEKLEAVTGAVYEWNLWSKWQPYLLDLIELNCCCYEMIVCMQAQLGMNGLELSICAYRVERLLSCVPIFSPDGVNSFQEPFVYHQIDVWLHDGQFDMFGLVQLVTEISSHGTTEHNQPGYAGMLDCFLEISSLSISGGVGLLFSGTEAMVMYLHCSFSIPGWFSAECSFFSVSEHSHWALAKICEKWGTTSEPTRLHSSDQQACAGNDLEFAASYGQEHSQGGRNVTNQATFSDHIQVGHNYYIIFVNKIFIGYDYYPDQGYYFDTIRIYLVYGRKTYHDGLDKINEVHAPWDPGKPAPRYPVKDLGLGTSRISRREECYDPRLLAPSWAAILS